MIHELRNNRTLLIEPTLFESKCKTLDAAENRADMETDCYGEDLPCPETVNGVCVIPIYGVIANRIPTIFKAYGWCDCDEIAEWVTNAINDSSVTRIVLDIDSPGGTVGGVMELAAIVAKSPKQIDVFTGGMCCSAAYWIACGARSITATPSADVGSIGVYTVFQDVSLMAKMMGIAVEVFRSDKYKGAGIPGTSLSDEQKALIQAEVDALASLFKSAVKTSRPQVADETMQGQSFLGIVAAENRLIDALANDFDEFING
jgi:signal peptide peptidase SppA